ncbi:MAG: PEGA domain-containing protein, partial [Vicinamibacterales bacterium]
MKRVATSLLCAVLWLGGVAVTRAAAQAPDAEVQLQISEVRRHFEALEYEQAIPAADRAVALLQARQGDAAKRTLADVLEIRARSRFGIGDVDGARQDFILLFKANPRHLLSGQVSPRVVTIFDEAKRATVTTLRLTLTPPDATVLVDGSEVSATGDIFVLVGPHTVSANRRGFRRGSREFAAEPEKIIRMSLVLTRSSAVLSVVTAPPDVEVIVDSVSRGRTVAGPLPPEFIEKAAAAGITPTDASGVLTLEDLPISTHRIELRGACLVPVVRTQTVTQLADYVLDPVKMAPAMATLVASAREADAIVFLDGEPRGKAPLTTELCEGAHVVELRAPTGRYLQRIDAKVGQRFEVTGALRPAFALVSSTQTALNADLRGAIERALQPLTSILVFAPPAETLDAALKA